MLLIILWFLGMLAYSLAFYRSYVRNGKITFWSWFTRLDVLYIKVVGLGIAGMWLHNWHHPSLQWLDNVLPHKPFAAFVFGFFVDVIALQFLKTRLTPKETR